MNPLVVYKASAGAGKTFTLALEYIKLLLLFYRQREYRHILAVTFTNKATTEMKERILSNLYSIAHGLSDADDLMKALRTAFDKERMEISSVEAEEHGIIFPGDDNDIRQRAKEALSEILHDYNNFRVQTIDSFFQLVLRGLAHELGLAANLQVDISDKEVLAEAVDRVVDEMSYKPEVRHWIESLANDRLEDMSGWDVTKAVKDFSGNIFNQDYLLHGDGMRRALADPDEVTRIFTQLKNRKNELGRQLSALADRLDTAVAKAGFQFEWMTYSNTLPAFIHDLRTHKVKTDSLAGTLFKLADEPLSVLRAALRKDNDKKTAVETVGFVMKEVLKELFECSTEWNSVLLTLEHFNSLLLLNHIDGEVTAINTENSRFTLAKTPILIREMVGSDDAPFIFEKIGAQLHHIMIDEFQDTSSLQWQNFRTLLLECRSRGGRNLVVGDVKQSIYRWRGGDWRTLGYIDTDVEEKPLAPVVQPLDTNYRSHQIVIDFNNMFFQRVATILDDFSAASEKILDIQPRTVKDDYGTEHQLRFFENAYSDVTQKVGKHNDGTGFVRVKLIDNSKKNKADGDEDGEIGSASVIDDLKDQVRSLLQSGLSASKMTILIRSRKHANPIIQAFALDPDMPRVVSDEAFLLSASEAVQTIIMALRIVDKPRDSVVQRFYLKERGIELSDSEVAAYRTVPLYDLVEQLYLRLLPEESHDQDAYLFSFFDAVADYQRNHSGGIHPFLDYWDESLHNQSVPAGEIDGIRILTIHKSKGLEFHTVFIPFCNWEIIKRNLTEIIWCQTDNLPQPYSDLHLIPVSSKKQMGDSVFAKQYHEYLLNSRFDELNTLYVAFTRARCNLYVWGVAKGLDMKKETLNIGRLVFEGVRGCAEYISGIPVTSDANKGSSDGALEPNAGQFSKEEESTTKEQPRDDKQNRMQPHASTCTVRMQSFPPMTTFCQSNSSRDFLASVSQDEYDDEAILNEISRQQMYIDIGRLLHRVFQNIHTWDDVPSVLDSFEHEGLITTASHLRDQEQQLRGQESGSRGVDRHFLEQIISRGRKNQKVCSWFNGSWTLFNECAIVNIDPATHIPSRRRPDRVMMSADGRKIIVVDFKFGKYNEEYDSQVREYMTLVGEMYPEASVKGFLWFVYSGKVMEIGK
ncbi:MAG: UvrD-helicase domain-containing protein [Bacteroidaceae bacterium]|nr:UvrD-helicase domain-containing protein [Bacteroidaceae bacterium]